MVFGALIFALDVALEMCRIELGIYSGINHIIVLLKKEVMYVRFITNYGR